MVNLYVISDSTGETANQLGNAIMIQFPSVEFNRKRYSNITNAKQVEKIFEHNEGKTIVLMTVVVDEVVNKIKSYQSEEFEVIDLLLSPITHIENFLGQKANRKPGLMRDLDNSYFNKIEAIEFAMNFDDGKNPKGFLEADIVLLGVSRTSKTPLSVYLANKSYKVANLPLVPEIEIPKEIYKVDKKKLIGLIIDPVKLNEIRNQRLLTLGLSQNSTYANDKRINEELEFAKKLYEDLGCTVIDVSSSTIEETAAKVIEQIEN
ncbi:pyruvate, water dikinase regulatory protein [Helcococcus ovis]|uniref:pyruvate, water dikinase regulatory protein n=1 Tax=Helcococcus TaxID=31983 RepID=UPI0010700E05|nr:pyruvate, water dikinase regulatory protein [Helcococcus ovis]TFF67198.1 kinase/pyrophosphorylase [Helcococcus ovis]WNZ01019.1 kinase/pyrophosphorylase [Helcococcus ovis]